MAIAHGYDKQKYGSPCTLLACEYSRFSFIPTTICETRRGTSAVLGQKFHTDDVNLSWIRTRAPICWPNNFDWLALQLFSDMLCEIVVVKIYLVLSPWKIFDSSFNLFVQCSASFRLIVLSAARRFCQFADRIRQVADISNGATRPHVNAWEHNGDSLIE